MEIDEATPLQKDEIANKFQNLLDWSRKDSSSLELNSEELDQEVLDFLLKNVNITGVLQELSQDVLLSKDLTQVSEEALFEHFCSIAQHTGTTVSMVASQIFAQNLFQIVKPDGKHTSDEMCYHLMPCDTKPKVKVLLEVMKKFKDDEANRFDQLTFIQNLPNKDVPMELIFLLHKDSVVSFRVSFASWSAHEEWLINFSQTLANLCFHDDKDNVILRKTILEVFLTELLIMSYGETSEYQEVAKKTVSEVVACFEEKGEKIPSEETKKRCRLCLYKIIREVKQVPAEIIHQFFREILSNLLAKPGSLTIVDAFKYQEQWTFEFLPEEAKAKYLQIILVFRCEEIAHVLQNAIETIKYETVDIKALCHLVTVYLIHSEDAYKLLDELLGHLLSECLENCDRKQFHVILLLRRQASLEGSHISPSYSIWFQQTFYENGVSIGLTTKKPIHFFFISLTELVPYDQPEFLKVHVKKTPRVPSKFSYYVDDYLSLAKTRLRDLNVPLEDSTSLFPQSSTDEERLQVIEQAKEDVERCLSLYEQSGKIPTTILEASIFRKPYFIGRFLPALLVPRDLSSEADARSRLIEDLRRAEKIPSGMLRSYNRKCERFEDFANNDDTLDNVQKLTHHLEKLPQLLIAMETGSDDTQEMQGWLSSTSRRLKVIFGPGREESLVQTVELDVVALNVDQDCIQASYALINVFCRTCAAVQNSCSRETNQANRTISKFHWASKFVTMLVSFPRLIQCIYFHLWSTLCHEPRLMTDEHIYGFAILICHLSCMKTPYTILLRSSTKEAADVCHESFVDFLSSQMSLSHKNCARLFLRWCSHYLQYAFVVFEKLVTELHQLASFAYVPKIMLLKVEYLHNKLKFSDPKSTPLFEKTEVEVLSMLMNTIYEAKLIQTNLSFKQWLIWEVNIQEDILLENQSNIPQKENIDIKILIRTLKSRRMEYYNWIVYERFLSVSEDANDQDTLQTAKELVSCLLDHSTRVEAGKTRSSTEIHLIKMLQDIINLISSSVSSEQSRDNPWLLDCFISRLSEAKCDESPSNEMKLRCEIMAFVRLTTQLSPWLLTCNYEGETLNRQNVKKLSEFLNEHLKPCLFPACLVLPFDFTAHVFKGFFQNLKPEHGSFRNQDAMFRQFIESTPFVYASIIYYWNQLRPLCNRYVTTSKTLQHLQLYYTWSNDIFSTTEQSAARSKLHLSQELACNEIGQGYAIFLLILKRVRQEFTSDIKDRLNGLLEDVLASKSGKEIVVCLYDAIMAYLSTMTLRNHMERMGEDLWHEIAKTVLFRYPEVLCIFIQELNQNTLVSSSRSILYQRKTHRLLSLVFFRTLTTVQRQILHHELPTEAFTQAILLMYNECSDFYLNSCDDALPDQPLDIATMVKITRFVKDFLTHVRPNVLQRVPECVVEKLPKEVQRYFSER